jgi:hypothetical protein
MKETEFKVLMHEGNYVDVNLLECGIYFSIKPFIYHKLETIESLIEKAENIKDAMAKHHISDDYFSNLRKCELVKVKIIEVKP